MSDRLGRNPFDKKRLRSSSPISESPAPGPQILELTQELEGELIELPSEDGARLLPRFPIVGGLVETVFRAVLRKH